MAQVLRFTATFASDCPISPFPISHPPYAPTRSHPPQERQTNHGRLWHVGIPPRDGLAVLYSGPRRSPVECAAAVGALGERGREGGSRQAGAEATSRPIRELADMRKCPAIILIVAVCCGCRTRTADEHQSAGGSPSAAFSGSAQWANDIDWSSSDWRTFLVPSVTAHEAYYRDLADKLKHSQVPNAEEATARAIRAGVDWDARAGWRVNALLRLALADADLGEEGDFVWEVRVVRSTNISGLVWVSTTTGKTKVLYPK